MPAIDFIFDLMAQGRYTFTVNEIADSLAISLTAARAALRSYHQWPGRNDWDIY